MRDLSHVLSENAPAITVRGRQKYHDRRRFYKDTDSITLEGQTRPKVEWEVLLRYRQPNTANNSGESNAKSVGRMQHRTESKGDGIGAE